MRFLSTLIIFSFVLASPITHANENAVTNERISEISQRLQTYSTDQLIERRDIIIKALEDEDDDEALVAIGQTRSNALLELSIIEQLLILAGIVMIDNISEESRTPPDTVSPVITVLGDNPATVELGDSYTDAGATADTGETVTTSGTVDTSSVGSYTITYSATDAAGNTGSATRVVNVVDTTAPTILVNGDNPVTVELGSEYTDAGATASDLDTVTVTSVSDVDTNTVGTYSVVYTATDASGNTANATRTVNVVDTTPPSITSPSTFSVQENQLSIGTVEVSDAGSVTFSVSGSDNIVIDQNGVLSFIVAPDFETQTEYTIEVTVTDSSGNTVTQVITITITNDPDDDDDDTGTGTGTGTGAGTGTGTGTG